MVTQDLRDLQGHCVEQFAFIAASARALDSGVKAEAKRIAVTIRVLMHQTNKSKALLHQLGVIQHLSMIDSAKPRVPGNLVDIGSLTCLGMRSDGAKLYARSHPEFQPLVGPVQPFGVWWNAGVVHDRSGRIFSRKDLVLALANQDGGAHVDPALTEPYGQLRKQNSFGWEFHPSKLPVDGIIEGSIRQIAHEVLCTFSPISYPPQGEVSNPIA